MILLLRASLFCAPKLLISLVIFPLQQSNHHLPQKARCTTEVSCEDELLYFMTATLCFPAAEDILSVEPSDQVTSALAQLTTEGLSVVSYGRMLKGTHPDC